MRTNGILAIIGLALIVVAVRLPLGRALTPVLDGQGQPVYMTDGRPMLEANPGLPNTYLKLYAIVGLAETCVCVALVRTVGKVLRRARNRQREAQPRSPR